MKLLAIDPGPKRSAWAIFNDGFVERFAIEDNARNLEVTWGRGFAADHLAIEMVQSFGMAVGEEVFQTVLWTGRFIQEFQPKPYTLVYRKDVKLHLCGTTKAKDKNIRQALIDRFGGSKEAAIGLKASPGPLYGIKADLWSVLAIGVTWLDTHGAKGEVA